MSASSTPTNVGLYINSFSKSSSDNSPYTHLLGTDGFGAYPSGGGNKIDDLINYMVSRGYNYALLYGLSSAPTFIDSNGSAGVAMESFNASGKAILQSVISRMNAFGIKVAAVCDVYKPNYLTNRFDGTSQVRKIVEYNNSVSSNEQFSTINYETEFWRFPLTTALNTEPISVSTTQAIGWDGVLPVDCVGQTSITNISGVTLDDFIKISTGTNTYYRQIVGLTNLSGNINSVTFDRPLPISAVGCRQYKQVHLTRAEVDYETFLYRAKACRAYLNANDTTGMNTEVYVGFPNYNDGVAQLARLYADGGIDPIIDRVNIAVYARTPNWNYCNGSYANDPTGTYNRVVDDILNNVTGSRELGIIISAESPTANAGGCDDPGSAYSGYFLEGRTLAADPSESQVFWPLINPTTQTTNRNYCGGSCCAPGTIFAPNTGVYDPRSIQDCWDYVLTYTSTPTCSNPSPLTGKTYNKAVLDGDITSGQDAKANWTTIVIFDQELMRPLITDPPPTSDPLFMSYSVENVSCNTFDDGMITVNPFGGTQPYTFDWEVFDIGTASWIPYVGTGSTTDQITNVPPGDYRCTLNDSASSTPYTTPTLTVTEPSIVSGVINITSSPCSGAGGSIDVVSGSGGPSSNYFCSLDAGVTIFPVPHSFTGLPTGSYNVRLYSGTPSTGCFFNASANITSSTAPTLSISGVDPTCSEGSDGSITMQRTSGGTSPYTYVLLVQNSLGGFTTFTFTTSSTTHTFTNIPWYSGASSILCKGTITDSKGCTSSEQTYTLESPDPISFTVNTAQPSCYGGLDGSIVVTPSGGTGPNYLFVWNNGFSETGTSSTLSGVGAGTYVVTVTDTNNCGNFTSVTLDQPDQITAVYTVNQPIPELNTLGSITLTSITGGTSPYTYLWSNTATTDSISGLSAGTYSVLISDSNGCSNLYSFILSNNCKDFTLTEFKVAVFKAECCSGKLAKKYIKYLESGRTDLANKLSFDLKFLTLAIQTLECIIPADAVCLDCLQVQNILSQIQKICDCDCCEEAGETKVRVNFNPETGEFENID